MLTLSSLTRTAKKYAIDSSVSNEEFLNAFIQPYIEAGRIKARNGEVFHLNAPRTSNLVNDKAFFFLLAVSDFNEGNVARSASDTVRDALDALIDTYDAMGQGFDLYLPLIGTGLSRAGLCHIDSYRLIAETLGRRAQNIHGNITIIVRPDDVIRLKPENKPR